MSPEARYGERRRGALVLYFQAFMKLFRIFANDN